MHPRAGDLPISLRVNSRWRRIGPSAIPALVVHPAWETGRRVPLVLWLHGRTAHKELDPGRYLRWMRAGMGVCALDLPGHGERNEPGGQRAEGSLAVVLRMMNEIDEVLSAIPDLGPFDPMRLAIGGMSAGGMAVMARLCRPHPFRCASVEASTGSWQHQAHRAMFAGVTPEEATLHDPIAHLEGWREIPFQAFHSESDRLVDFAGQRAFVDVLRSRYRDPGRIEFVSYPRTGAPEEHIGFGRLTAAVKEAQVAFMRRHLLGEGWTIQT